MGWLEDQERIIALEAEVAQWRGEVTRLRLEVLAAVSLCEEQIATAPLMGYPMDGAYVSRWREAKARFDEALEIDLTEEA